MNQYDLRNLLSGSAGQTIFKREIKPGTSGVHVAVFDKMWSDLDCALVPVPRLLPVLVLSARAYSFINYLISVQEYRVINPAAAVPPAMICVAISGDTLIPVAVAIATAPVMLSVQLIDLWCT